MYYVTVLLKKENCLFLCCFLTKQLTKEDIGVISGDYAFISGAPKRCTSGKRSITGENIQFTRECVINKITRTVKRGT